MEHDHTHDHSHGHQLASPDAGDGSSPERPPKQEQEQATTDVTEVAPGIVRTQLPISMPGLGHVNCYLLEDERGIAIVDPGLAGSASRGALKSRLAAAGIPMPKPPAAI